MYPQHTHTHTHCYQLGERERPTHTHTHKKRQRQREKGGRKEGRTIMHAHTLLLVLLSHLVIDTFMTTQNQ